MENYSYIFGIVPAPMFLAMLVFAGIGVVISLLIHSTKRDPASKRTPEKFSFKFLLYDNWKSIALSILIILMTLRFATQFFPDRFSSEGLNDPLGIERWLFGALLIGLGFNYLVQIWKDKSDFLKVVNNNKPAK